MITAAAIKQDGQIYRGLAFKERHHDVIRQMVQNFNLPRPIIGEQGFISDTGLFLSREDAATHALNCGQIKALKFNSTKLFSEDLW